MVGVGLIVALILALGIAAFVFAPKEWIQWVFGGLIAGFVLGAVFGVWIARRIGNVPNPYKIAFGVGIVVLNAAVGFFAIPFLIHEEIELWPRDLPELGWSIGTASTLVSASIVCLVNFFWHSRDQQRINTLRAVLNKSRVKVADVEAQLALTIKHAAEASAKADEYRQRAEAAERQCEEERKKAELAQQAVHVARSTAEGAQKTAQQAQLIAEKEKRWRLVRQMLLGRWRCVEYSTRHKDAEKQSSIQIFAEPVKDRDILMFGADDMFVWYHPGKTLGLLERLQGAFGKTAANAEEPSWEKCGQWRLNENADAILIRYAGEATDETVKISSLDKTRFVIDKSSETWEHFRILEKSG